MSLWLRLWSVVAVLAGALAQAHAHGLAPILVQVEEPRPGEVRVRWTVSTAGSGMGLTEQGTPLVLQLPEHCRPVQRLSGPGEPRFRSTLERFRCERALSGEVLSIPRLAQAQQPVVLRYRGPAGQRWMRTLSGAEHSLRVPEAGAAPAGAWSSLRRYLTLGVEHILSGWDHLAFVLCLALLARGLRPLLWAVSAFTLAHSATLALATLGLLRLPGPPVEACIALSVLLLAARAAKGGRGAPQSPQALALTALAFGLLHGLGFAGALREVGFAGAPLAAALLGFNLGVELGQLLVLGVAAFALWALRRSSSTPAPSDWARMAVAELAGLAAGYWLVERLWSFAPA